MNASEQIAKKIAGLADWRGRELARLRKLVNGVNEHEKGYARPTGQEPLAGKTIDFRIRQT